MVKKVILAAGLLLLAGLTIFPFVFRTNATRAQHASTSTTTLARSASKGKVKPYTYMPTHKLDQRASSNASIAAAEGAKQSKNQPATARSSGAASTPAAKHAAGAGLATWTSSFTTGGQNYPYTMVGTDPTKGSATTTVSVDLIPLIFTFSDGTKIDGTQVTQNIISSPLFQNNTYATGDNTQYADAIQRAEFWNTVSKTSPNYHMLLGQPAVQPTVTLTVPAASGSVVNGVGKVDINWFSPQADQLATAAGRDPSHLTIFAVTTVDMYQGTVNQCCIGGYHTAVQDANNTTFTYAYAGYGTGSQFFKDVEALSHEIAEWANDPLTNNTVPNWSVPAEPQYGCQSILEDGDPLVGNTFQFGNYHVQDEAYFSWFSHDVPSQGFQQQYDYSKVFNTFAPGCTTGPTPTPGPTNTPTPNPTNTPTPGPTNTPTPGPTNTPTPNPTPGPGGNLINNGGFENGSSSWVENSSGGYELVDNAIPHTGSASAHLCGYNNCQDSIAQQVSIPANATSAMLNYYWYVNTQETSSKAYDDMYVRVLDSNGNTLGTLQTITNASSANSWQSSSYDLSAYKGQTVQIAFVTANDYMNPTGFYVDDVALNAQ